MDLLKGLVDDKVLRVLKVFLLEPDQFFHINKVSQDSEVPLATTFRIINSLVNNNMLKIEKIGKFKLYRLADNKKIKQLRKII